MIKHIVTMVLLWSYYQQQQQHHGQHGSQLGYLRSVPTGAFIGTNSKAMLLAMLRNVLLKDGKSGLSFTLQTVDQFGPD